MSALTTIAVFTRSTLILLSSRKMVYNHTQAHTAPKSTKLMIFLLDALDLRYYDSSCGVSIEGSNAFVYVFNMIRRKCTMFTQQPACSLTSSSESVDIDIDCCSPVYLFMTLDRQRLSIKRLLTGLYTDL